MSDASHSHHHDHGHGDGHSHGHKIMPLLTLRAVLAVLLVLTGLTVFAAVGEQWVMNTFDVTLPGWVNLVVALSIATVKGVLVLAYFMQLKYDNPINTCVFLFCMLGFFLFLGFTAIDLGNRDLVYSYKSGEIQKGGMGGLVRQTSAGTETVQGNMTSYVRTKMIEKMGGDMKAFSEAEAAAHAKSHAKHKEHAPEVSSAGMSRPRSGLSGALETAESPAPADAKPSH
ncbi:MAG: cytochrome C oxidase subunit IV family protein [Planctomycetota bacterium]|nr:cytochrome C oxidase subunit IV family protein [Planctomycetota bacterium]